MQSINWGNAVFRPLIVGLAVYIVMHFLVPRSIDSNTRSLIGGAVAFVVATIVLQVRSAK